MLGQIAPGQALTLRGIGRDLNRLVAEGALSMTASGRVATPELSNERIEELAALRALIEVELASRALPRAHMALIDRLHAINSSIGDAVSNRDAVGYIRTNLEFHRTLYLRAQAPAMLAMAETVWLQLGPTMRALYGRLRRSEPPQYHRLIIAALKAGDEPSLRLFAPKGWPPFKRKQRWSSGFWRNPERTRRILPLTSLIYPSDQPDRCGQIRSSAAKNVARQCAFHRVNLS